MSVEAQKPVMPVEVAPAAEPIAAPAPVVATAASEEKPIEAVEPKTEETPKTEGEAAVAASVEEKKEEKVVEPIYSGALGYKAPGLKNIFRFSKKYFWFGEEAVPTSSLNQYLRGEEPSTAHTVAAWSSVTGKGLLYFVKHADQKQTPAGVLKLADATDLSKDGTIGFHFKLHGSKHAFEAQSAPERNGWFVAVEKAIEEAKASKDEVHNHETYKSELEKLGKPATLAAPAATTPKKSTEVAPKKSTDLSHKPTTEGEIAPATETALPARTGSSSSSSDEEKKQKKAAKSKSRSVSRGKRSSIFGSILGKKEKTEEKVEEKKAEKEEKKIEKEENEDKKIEKDEIPAVGGEPSAPAPVVIDVPVVAADLPPVEATKAEETPVVESKEEKKVEEKPKPTKRASMFGSFVEKIRSPTQEKKQPEFAAPAASKEPEVSAEPPKIEAPATEEAPIAPVTVLDGTTDAPKAEEIKPATTPAKEKQHFSFGKFLGGSKEKAKSPSTEQAPEALKTEEAPKIDETPAPVAPIAPIEPAVPAVDAPAPVEAAPVEEKKEEPVAEATTPTTKKRGSIFGALGGGSVKKDKDGEEKPQGLKGLFRNASKAGKPKKEKEPVIAPAKVDETVEPKEEKTEAAPLAEEKKATDAAPATTEQSTIGDVVPDAVTVGQAPKSTPEVATTA